jgi:hypothetical protein
VQHPQRQQALAPEKTKCPKQKAREFKRKIQRKREREGGPTNSGIKNRSAVALIVNGHTCTQLDDSKWALRSSHIN